MAIAYNPSIARNGLILHLDAANIKSYSGSGTTWSDLSTSKNNVTLVNTPTYNNAGYFTFDGVNEQGNLASTIATEAPSFSSFSWIYRNDSTTVDTIFGASGKYGAFLLTTDGRLRLQTASSNVFSIESNASLISNATWYHVGVTRGSSTDKLYINGVEVASGTVTRLRTFGDMDRIGQTFNTDYFNGRISNIVVYNRELSVSEIKQNFEALRGRYSI